MRIVGDESVDKQIIDALRARGHEVLYIAELDPGIDDEAVLSHSRRSSALLLTADKDFGDLVFRQHQRYSGILLIRLEGLNPDQKAALVVEALNLHAEEISTGFAVLSRRMLRIRRQSM